MKIGMVTAHSFPSAREVRLTRMAASLSASGHTCVVFCPASTEEPGVQAFSDGHVVRRASKNKSFFGKVSMAAVPISPFWAAWLIREFRKHKVEVVIARDMRLSLPAMKAARAVGAKFVLDIAEHYPGMMRIVHKPGLLARLYRNPALIEWLERRTVRKSGRVWVVCEENAKRLQVYNPNVAVINNFPLRNELTTNAVCQHRVYTDEGASVRIVSFGLINEIRGLELAIDAFSHLVEMLPNIRLVIFGDGPTRATLEKQAGSRGLGDKVEFRGAVQFEQRYEAMSEGDIGIIFHRVCDLTQHTLPNKLFDYMSVGMPVIATHLRPVMRVLRQEECGITVDEDVRKVAEGLRDLILKPMLRRQMGQRGRMAVRERYVWENEVYKITCGLEQCAGPAEVLGK